MAAAAPAYLAAVLEPLRAEILDLASDVARESKKTRINPRPIVLAIRNNEQLDKVLDCVTIAQGGVLPLHPPRAVGQKDRCRRQAGTQEAVAGVLGQLAFPFPENCGPWRRREGDERRGRRPWLRRGRGDRNRPEAGQKLNARATR